ncbi:uncharacterized protein LOC116346183 [Contarinia nasturtii]|uniref:uncharacterized protein LOC116346183 n=1 Tax=Contarinia nasturtii TaxID=265458 RepID=UPI0012D491CC|nr:uncharacterized protein LOC116346183 [Contarinia nasturtii]
MKFFLIFPLLLVIIFDQFDLTNGAPSDPAFTTFLNILQTKIESLRGNRGHNETDNLHIVFQIDSNMVPNNIKRPRCKKIEDRLIEFADNPVGSSRRHAALPVPNTFLGNCRQISGMFNEIRSSILNEPTIEEIDSDDDEEELSYDQLLESFRGKTINNSYISRITEDMITGMNQDYNDICSRLINQMNVVNTERAEYIKLILPKMQIMSLASMQNIFETMDELQQILLSELEKTVDIVLEFNVYRAQLARSFMQL